MVYQQTRRWLAAGCFEAIVHDLRAVLRFAAGREPEPTAAIFDGRTIPSTRESGGRAGYDGDKRRKGFKVHAAVDTLGHLLALHVTPANEQERDQVGVLAKAMQEVTGESVELAYVDQGYTGADAASAAAEHGIQLEVVKLPEAKRGFVLLPRRWVIELLFKLLEVVQPAGDTCGVPERGPADGGILSEADRGDPSTRVAPDDDLARLPAQPEESRRSAARLDHRAAGSTGRCRSALRRLEPNASRDRGQGPGQRPEENTELVPTP